jgi:hypothetical protein
MGNRSVPLTLNRYAYALDNPMRYVDPTGHASTSYGYFNTTTTQTTTYQEDGYTLYDTTTTTTFYEVTTTCYSVYDCVTSTATIATQMDSWVLTESFQKSGQTCPASSTDTSWHCDGDSGSSSSSSQNLLNGLSPSEDVELGLGGIAFWGEAFFEETAEAVGLAVAGPATGGLSLLPEPLAIGEVYGSLPGLYESWYTFGYGLGRVAADDGY